MIPNFNGFECVDVFLVPSGYSNILFFFNIFFMSSYNLYLLFLLDLSKNITSSCFLPRADVNGKIYLTSFLPIKAPLQI
jgi:hypothetical protein